jgi:hypothetical protein
MAMVNLLIKTLGASGFPPQKFVLILDSAIKSSIRSFQIMPAGTLSVDSGSAEFDPLQGPDASPIFGVGPSDDSQKVVFELDGAGAILSLGMQGTGDIADNAKSSGSMYLLWRVIAVAGPTPAGWPSMDIYQDLPAPQGDTAVV